MARPHKILRKLTIMGASCACLLLPDAALAHTGAQIKAEFDSGLAAYDAGNYRQAFTLWWDLQYEDLAAMRNLAMMLRKGQGTAKDPKKAEEIYQRAAEAGLPTAQADLADMLMKGEAGPPDLQSALPLLQAAAAANHPVAQFQLGELYETGAPPLVPQNVETARQLYIAAASHGMTAATDRLRALPPLTPQDGPKVAAQPAAIAAAPTSSAPTSAPVQPAQPYSAIQPAPTPQSAPQPAVPH